MTTHTNGGGGYVVKLPDRGGIRVERVASGAVLTGQSRGVVHKWTYARFYSDGSVKRIGGEQDRPTRFGSEDEARAQLARSLELRRAYEVTGIGPGHRERSFTSVVASQDGRPTKTKEKVLPWGGLQAGLLELAEIGNWSEYETQPNAARAARLAKVQTERAQLAEKRSQLDREIADLDDRAAIENPTSPARDWHAHGGEAQIQCRVRADGGERFRFRTATVNGTTRETLEDALADRDSYTPAPPAAAIPKDADGEPMGGFGVGRSVA